MKLYSELQAALKTRMASRSNPTGITANDLGAYTAAQMKASYDTLIPVDTIGVSQIGDQSYFPLAIDGAADGAIGMTDYRCFTILREVNGDFVGLRTATNSIKRAVYYAIGRANSAAAITSVTSSSRQYLPNLPAGWEPITVFAGSADVLYGLAMHNTTFEQKLYIAKINGTYDQTKHQASLIDGGLTPSAGILFTQCQLIGNTVFIYALGTSGGDLGSDIYATDITNIGKGTTLTSTRVQGITSVTMNGNTVTADRCVLANPFLTNANPGVGTMFPRRIKLLSTVKGTMIRTLVEISWYTATNDGKTRSGLIIYCMTYDTATKRFTVNPEAEPVSFVTEPTGHVRFGGASSRADVDADYRDGFTRTGAGNVTASSIITADGVIGTIANDNNSLPFMFSYKIGGFSGDAFTELLKLVPSVLPNISSQYVKDREVGPITSSGHIGFLSKTRVSFTKGDVDNPGWKRVGYTDNNWDLTYRYKSDQIDAVGFPPTSRSADLGMVNYRLNFIAMMTGPDTVTYSGSVLHQSGLQRRTVVDSTTFLDSASGAVISVTQAELNRAALAALALYTTEGYKQTSYDQTFCQLIVPPDPTAPAIMYVFGLNVENLILNWMALEFVPSARSGQITVGAMTKIMAGAAGSVRAISPDILTLSHVTYLKTSDGWIICGIPNSAVNWVGNTGWFQFILGKRNSDNAWPFAYRTEAYSYYSNSGSNWAIHPVWGVGYCDLAVTLMMAGGGQIFNALGSTIAEISGTWTVRSKYMVLSAIAAAGYNLYVNEPITVLMAGSNYILPISRLNLQDLQADPSNSTWYISIVLDNGAVKLAASKNLAPNDPNALINIGNCITGATQIQTLNLSKTTMIGNNVVA